MDVMVSSLKFMLCDVFCIKILVIFFYFLNIFFIVNRVKEGTGVVINISENDGSNVIRIEGNLAGVLKAQTVCNTSFMFYK